MSGIHSATRACELSEWTDPLKVDTLAAAYAECGNFSEAIKWEAKVVGMNPKDDQLASDARMRLALYESGEPYRSK